MYCVCLGEASGAVSGKFRNFEKFRRLRRLWQSGNNFSLNYSRNSYKPQRHSHCARVSMPHDIGHSRGYSHSLTGVWTLIDIHTLRTFTDLGFSVAGAEFRARVHKEYSTYGFRTDATYTIHDRPGMNKPMSDESRELRQLSYS